jgi:hypothetical protein
MLARSLSEQKIPVRDGIEANYTRPGSGLIHMDSLTKKFKSEWNLSNVLTMNMIKLILQKYDADGSRTVNYDHFVRDLQE